MGSADSRSQSSVVIRWWNGPSLCHDGELYEPIE
jgi:hypothetical protein